jgi:hypothetical protein
MARHLRLRMLGVLSPISRLTSQSTSLLRTIRHYSTNRHIERTPEPCPDSTERKGPGAYLRPFFTSTPKVRLHFLCRLGDATVKPGRAQS